MKDGDSMTAKEYLQQLQRLDIMINQKTKELDTLRLQTQSIGSIDYSKERVQTSPSGDAPFVKLIGKITDLEAEIDKYVDKKHQIINQIQSLQNVNYIFILFKRYVEFKKFKAIAIEMDFTYDHIRHLHGCALQDFQNKILNLTHKNT